MPTKLYGRLISAILGSGFLLLASQVPALGQVTQAEMKEKSSIVFHGTVLQFGAASFPDVPVSPAVMIVKVEEVLKKPGSISLAKGDSVTVRAQDPSAFAQGSRAVFYTNGWIFGVGLAVIEVGHELSSETGALAVETLTEARSQLGNASLRARLREAAAVVVGRVVEIRPMGGATLEAAPQQGPISEHAPMWREAVIKVETGLKGASRDDQLVVRFPSSRDIAWFGVPKFQKDQEGTFILRQDEISGAATTLLEGVSIRTYTASTAADVLGKEEASRVKALMAE